MLAIERRQRGSVGTLSPEAKEIAQGKPQKKAARDPRVNAHGVITSGYETITIPLAKSLGCHAIIHVAEFAGYWLVATDAQRKQSAASGPLSPRHTHYPTRQDAMLAGLEALSRFFSPVGHEPAAEIKRMKSCALAIADYRAKAADDFVMESAPQPPETLDHEVGHFSAPVQAAAKTPSRKKSALNPKSKEAAAERIENMNAEREAARSQAPPEDWLAQPISNFSLCNLVRHPKNRRPTAVAVDMLAEDMRARKKRGEQIQLEAIVTRSLPSSHPDWPAVPGAIRQVLSGETRMLALLKIGEYSAATRNIDCADDAKALELVHAFNAKRTDLTPIDKAIAIRDLCEPKKKGGCGLTLKQAGEMFNVSEGEASNLRRLLELTPDWLELVAAGHLGQTLAREILTVMRLPSVLDELRSEFAQHHAGEPSAFDSRETLKQKIQWLIAALPRTQDLPRKLKAADRERLHLQTLELPTGQKGKSTTVEVVANLEAFRELTTPIGPVAEFDDTDPAIAETRPEQPSRHVASAGPDTTAPPAETHDRPSPKTAASAAKPSAPPPNAAAVDRKLEIIRVGLLDFSVSRVLANTPLDTLAKMLGVSVLDGWQRVQEKHNKHARKQFTACLESFDLPTLFTLASEWSIFLDPKTTKPAAIKKFLAQDRVLPLPKCLAPPKKKRKGK